MSYTVNLAEFQSATASDADNGIARRASPINGDRPRNGCLHRVCWPRCWRQAVLAVRVTRVMPHCWSRCCMANAQCSASANSGLTWIDDPVAWRQRYQQLTSAWMNPPPLPVVDFSRAGVLLVAMGARSSAGYVLRLAEPDAHVADGVLTPQVDWQEPAPGYAQAQVLSSPCLLLLCRRRPSVVFGFWTSRDGSGYRRPQAMKRASGSCR